MGSRLGQECRVLGRKFKIEGCGVMSCLQALDIHFKVWFRALCLCFQVWRVTIECRIWSCFVAFTVSLVIYRV